MKKGKQNRFAFSEALHEGDYLDRSLSEFAKRIPTDPYHGTKWEGMGAGRRGFPREAKNQFWARLQGEANEMAATAEPRANALARQNEGKRTSLRWLRALPEKKRRQLALISPQIGKILKKAGFGDASAEEEDRE